VKASACRQALRTTIVPWKNSCKFDQTCSKPYIILTSLEQTDCLALNPPSFQYCSFLHPSLYWLVPSLHFFSLDLILASNSYKYLFLSSRYSHFLFKTLRLVWIGSFLNFYRLYKTRKLRMQSETAVRTGKKHFLLILKYTT
jgi:hypothetical protein